MTILLNRKWVICSVALANCDFSLIHWTHKKRMRTESHPFLQQWAVFFYLGSVACFFPETTSVGVSQPSAKEKVVLSSGCTSPTEYPETIYLGYFPCKVLKSLHNLQGAGVIMCLFDMTCRDLSEADSTLHTKICYFFSLLMQCKFSSTQISWCCKHCLQRNAQSDFSGYAANLSFLD